MNDNVNRREMLRMSGVGISITGWYMAANSRKVAASSPSEPDLVVTNNGRQEYRIKIEIEDSTSGSPPVFSRTLAMGGFNQSGERPDNFKFQGKISATGHGRYDVSVSVIEGTETVDSGATTVTLTPDGVARGTQLKIYVDLDGQVDAFVGG